MNKCRIRRSRESKPCWSFLPRKIPKREEPTPNSFIDNSIIKELEASGFIRDLYGK